ncbi:ABC transporter permease [Paenibacillus abyssi]|uniref:Multidrug ABC transporter permease n=1 Tax=Paenibacillus abyssi TaxID=1340531 RepID=A0A917G760_9BACL|nr:ABC-2 family transporter protein [Paenibacillus abyssi]GGG26051.1 multidrug ABC transporter permease [Paenibacillus abyssi]
MKWSRAIYIYFRLMTQHVKAILEYQADFWIAMCAAMLTQILGIVFIWVIFDQITDIHGWVFWEIAFLYSLVFMSEGVSSFLFNGIWLINSFVNRGEMDRFLVRPLPPVLQVASSAFGMNGIGNLAIGIIFLIQSIRHIEMAWTWWQLLLVVVFVISGVMIRISVNLASNSISFWTQGPRNSFPMMIHTVSDFVKYPITIFTGGIQLFVSIAVPYAFISYYPASFLFGKGEDWSWLGMLTPVVAAACLMLSIRLFNTGLRKYESAGN